MKMLLLPSFLIAWTLCIARVFSSTEVVKAPQDLVNGYSGSEILDASVVTVRVNTFRRLDLLEIFLEHYAYCENVKQIQVVWSDQKAAAPNDWLSKYPAGKVVFETHSTDSLNNRFHNLTSIPTEAVLSIDDDLVIPCLTLSHAVTVWRSNQRALVGFSPRMIVYDIITGKRRYLRWQHTWWSGSYALVLTKACLLHRDYLQTYTKNIPQSFLSYIDEKRNCEDIAMAHSVAMESKAAPVWFSGTIYETGTSGISSQAKHFIDRGECVSRLEALTGFDSWVLGYQKVVPIGWTNIMRWWSDTK